VSLGIFHRAAESLVSSSPPKENLVLQEAVLFILSTMNQKHRFWLLALFLATLSLSSCLNQEGVAPAEGELKTPGGAGGY
jgi:hypothetical protein